MPWQFTLHRFFKWEVDDQQTIIEVLKSLNAFIHSVINVSKLICVDVEMWENTTILKLIL